MRGPDFDNHAVPSSFTNVEVPTAGFEGLSESDAQAFDDLARRSMQEVAALLAAADGKHISQAPTSVEDHEENRADDDGMNLGKDLISASSQEEGEK